MGLNAIVFVTLLTLALIPLEIRQRRINPQEQSTGPSSAYSHWGASYPHVKNEIYSLKPGHYSRQISGVEETFDISADGYRQLNFDTAKKVDVAIYGDSFTFGHAVKQGQRFSDVFSLRSPHLNVANFAYNGGFTAPHYLKHFNLTSHAPRWVFTFSYAGNDCQADLNESILESLTEGGYPTRVITPEGYLTGDRSDYPAVVKFTSRYSHFMKSIFARLYSSSYGRYFFSVRARPNTPNKKSFDLGEDKTACYDAFAYYKGIEAACQTRNPACKLVNFIIPQDFFVYDKESQTGHTVLDAAEQEQARKNPQLFANIMANCSILGLRCVDLLPVFTAHKSENLYLLSDGHWTPRGHELVAELLQQIVTAKITASQTSY
jgi:hypothetical protein